MPPACNYWQICLNFQTKREIALWLWNDAVEYALKSNIDVERFKGLNTLLKALGEGKVWLLDGNSSIGFCGVQSHDEQVDNLLIDEVVITPEVFFIDLQTGSREEKCSIWWVPWTRLYGFTLWPGSSGLIACFFILVGPPERATPDVRGTPDSKRPDNLRQCPGASQMGTIVGATRSQDLPGSLDVPVQNWRTARQ
jgi:hypothetical protein